MAASHWLSAALAALLMSVSWSDEFARLASPELRLHDARVREIRAALEQMPPAPEDHSSARVGWHSTFGSAARPQDSSRSVTLDLGETKEFDSVVLIPVSIADGQWAGPGYGFPVRFRVETADEQSFAAPRIVADQSAEDFANPGSLPVELATPGGRGRFVRVTATKLFTLGTRSLFALSEIMVWHRHANLALGCPGTASGNYENAPMWQLSNLTDGQSVLGGPVRVAPPTVNGYHSKVTPVQETEKWVQLDLGRSLPIEEVRLFAARPRDFPARPGFGFPLRFRLEASETPDFGHPIALAEYRDADCPSPGDNPFIVPAHQTMARYVRMTATKLWPRHHDFVFALSELQVFAGGENVARGAGLTALDTIDINRWLLPYLVDGWSDEGELIDWRDWLHALSRRRALELALVRMNGLREPLLAQAWRRLGVWSVTGVALLALLVGAWLWRQYRARLHELARLRQRIAGDLHDEIGSNLGSIALLAGLAAEQRANGARADLLEIRDIARETTESMRDIVWLLRPRDGSPHDLVTKIREVAGRQLVGLVWSLEAGTVTGPFPLEVERHLLLVSKEALHNVVRHAGAQAVRISLEQNGRQLRLKIVDDGAGFDPTLTVAGQGLASMRHRARLLGGELALRSHPAGGTEIDLRVPLS